MMVNEVKNNLVPWQSTVPQQMPWMSSYQPTSFGIQFGQQPSPNVASDIILSNVAHPLNQSVQQHPSLANFATATTLTSPITSCPTSISANPSFTTGGIGVSSNCVTATTQSYPGLQNLIQAHPASELNNYALNTFTPITQPNNNHYMPSASLTHIPTLASLSSNTVTQQKRSSVEMEDEQIMAEEPPTKQLLSERKLFKQFGSLHLNANIERGVTLDDSDDSEEDDGSQATTGKSSDDREEFNRYVYLLFKDKKGNNGGVSFASNRTLDRLARDERDKLSKAVVLWSPPLKDRILGNDAGNDDDDDDDDDFKYSDHRDFLKKSAAPNDSIIITEVTGDEGSCNNITMNVNAEPTYSDPDDIMIE